MCGVIKNLVVLPKKCSQSDYKSTPLKLLVFEP